MDEATAMTPPTPEQRDPEQGLASMDGPHTHHPDVPFYDWTVLTATDADGVQYWFHVPTAALATAEPGEAGLRAALTSIRAYARARYPSDDPGWQSIDAIAEAALRAPVADAGLDVERAALTTIRDLTLDVPAAHGNPESYYLGQLRTAIGTAARALATTPTEPDASFDDPVLEADPAPTWKGGLLGTDRPLTTIPEA